MSNFFSQTTEFGEDRPDQRARRLLPGGVFPRMRCQGGAGFVSNFFSPTARFGKAAPTIAPDIVFLAAWPVGRGLCVLLFFSDESPGLFADRVCQSSVCVDPFWAW